MSRPDDRFALRDISGSLQNQKNRSTTISSNDKENFQAKKQSTIIRTRTLELQRKLNNGSYSKSDRRTQQSGPQRSLMFQDTNTRTTTTLMDPNDYLFSPVLSGLDGSCNSAIREMVGASTTQRTGHYHLSNIAVNLNIRSLQEHNRKTTNTPLATSIAHSSEAKNDLQTIQLNKCIIDTNQNQISTTTMRGGHSPSNGMKNNQTNESDKYFLPSRAENTIRYKTSTDSCGDTKNLYMTGTFSNKEFDYYDAATANIRENASNESSIIGCSQKEDFQYKMEQVQADLRKAVYALVKIRSKSESIAALVSNITPSSSTQGAMKQYQPSYTKTTVAGCSTRYDRQSFAEKKEMSWSPQNAHCQIDLRKDIIELQRAVVLAKEHMDELCADWKGYRFTTVEETKSALIPKQSNTRTSVSSMIKPLSPKGHADVCLSKQNNHYISVAGTLRQAHDKTNAEESIESNELVKTKQARILKTELNSVPQNNANAKTLEDNVQANHTDKETLERANDLLAHTVKALLYDCRQLEELMPKRASKGILNKGFLLERNQDGACVDLYFGENKVTIGSEKREQLSKAIQAMTSTLSCLIEERDFLVNQLELVNGRVIDAEVTVKDLERRNEQLSEELFAAQSKFEKEVSDRRTVAAHGRVISSSLVFSRSELLSAKKRILHLERTIDHLKNQTK